MLLSATALGAFSVNVGGALLMARFRHVSGSLPRVAFLPAHSDAFSDIAAWPDPVVGLAIPAINADAVKSVWHAIRDKHAAAAKA